MAPLFDRFIQERRYITNVSTHTIEWHNYGLAWLRVEKRTEAAEYGFVVLPYYLLTGPVRRGDLSLACRCRLHATKTQMIGPSANFAFAACAHHITGAVLVGA
jgi:hypothetical protein